MCQLKLKSKLAHSRPISEWTIERARVREGEKEKRHSRNQSTQTHILQRENNRGKKAMKKKEGEHIDGAPYDVTITKQRARMTISEDNFPVDVSFF